MRIPFSMCPVFYAKVKRFLLEIKAVVINKPFFQVYC